MGAVTQAHHDEDSLITDADNDELVNEGQDSHGATPPDPHAQLGHSAQSFISGRPRRDSGLVCGGLRSVRDYNSITQVLIHMGLYLLGATGEEGEREGQS